VTKRETVLEDAPLTRHISASGQSRKSTDVGGPLCSVNGHDRSLARKVPILLQKSVEACREP